MVDKIIVKGKNTFGGCLFYYIMPDKASKLVTFYFIRANSSEDWSVDCGIPLFIRGHFNLGPVFFCNSGTLTAALEGDWDFKAR